MTGRVSCAEGALVYPLPQGHRTRGECGKPGAKQLLLGSPGNRGGGDMMGPGDSVVSCRLLRSQPRGHHTSQQEGPQLLSLPGPRSPRPWNTWTVSLQGLSHPSPPPPGNWPHGGPQQGCPGPNRMLRTRSIPTGPDPLRGSWPPSFLPHTVKRPLCRQ